MIGVRVHFAEILISILSSMNPNVKGLKTSDSDELINGFLRRLVKWNKDLFKRAAFKVGISSGKCAPGS